MVLKQLVIYFGLAYLISWIIWLPLYGGVIGLGHMPILPYHHAIGGLGPLLASFITTWIFNRQAGVKQLMHQCIKVHPAVYFTIALLSPFLLACIASMLCYVIDKTPVNISGLFSSNEYPHFNLAVFFIYNLIFFGWGEEAGWRGFALPRFQKKFNALTSSILLTFFWAIWHWPLFFYRPGYTSMDEAGIFGWVFSLLTGSILLTWLYNSSRGSILICAVFHSTIDIAFTADLANVNIVNYMGFLITIWGIITILVFRPRNLSALERQMK